MYFSGAGCKQASNSEQQFHRQQYSTCSQGHRSSLILETLEGGSICLLCLSNLISNPKSPTIHVSYALSQLSQAISQPHFLQNLLTFHPHFLVSPLVNSLSSFDDESLAKQIMDLISDLCGSGDCSLCGEFVSRVADRLSSGSLAWSQRQVYMLHCLGILLDYQKMNSYVHIKDKAALIQNLVTGLRLPSEEIQGEILFVLYKISVLQHADMDDDGADILSAYCPKLLHLSLEALLKTQRDDVRLNCVAFLSVLARRGFFENAFANDTSGKNSFEVDNFMQTTDDEVDGTPLNLLFAEAIKAPLLSLDCEVQIATLDLIFMYLSCGGGSEEEIVVLVEENIADYVFEILRLSGCKDPVVNSCLQVLHWLSVAESAFRQRLAIGFTTLVPVLRYVADIPLHPVQCQSLKLISECVTSCPGIVSSSSIEEISIILTGMLKKHNDGETGMIPETFTLVCSVFVALMKSPSSHGILNFVKSVEDSSRHAILICLSFYTKHSCQILHSLYLLKEAYAYSYEGSPTNSNYVELRKCILDVCKMKLLPWFLTAINELDEDVALGVLESFHSILLQDDFQSKEFADILVSCSWFSFSFGCLGMFPTEKMKCRVYFLFSSILDVLLGNDTGQHIRDAALHLPTDPTDLLFLLGQKGSGNEEISYCQSAILLLMYSSSFYGDRLADDKLVLASLEQHIILNSNEILHWAADPAITEVLAYLYGLYRGLAKMSYQIPYSPEAERILFNLLAEKEWDLQPTRMHSTSLRWWFQQDRICKLLSNQILKLCRGYSSFGNQIVANDDDCQNTQLRTIGELVASGDNLGARLLVCLLREHVEEGGQEDDIILVLNMITTIIDIFPAASDHLCLHGIAIAIQNLYHSSHSCSTGIFVHLSRLVFAILHSVHSESLSDDDAWLAVTTKLLLYLSSTLTANGWPHEVPIVIGVLSLILHHSTVEVLVESSKNILLNTHLVSIIKHTISEASSKGPALFDHDEGTKTGETLIFAILLNYFSFRSVHVVLPGIANPEDLLGIDNGKQSLAFISIACHDLCRLLHFGSPPIKLVSSFCLLELFKRISDQRNKETDLNCTSHYLRSVIAVLEGMIFCSDIRIAMNCALCISMMLGWQKKDGEAFIGRDNWCRLIVEELVMGLAVPCLASKSFMIHHKPVIHVAVAILNLHEVPKWISDVFDDSCICSIVQNLSAGNMTREIVLLFRELLRSGYLKADHIGTINQVFQACRKRMYSDDIQDTITEENMHKMAIAPDDLDKVYKVLINLVASQSSLDTEFIACQVRNKGLLDEIELYFKTVMETNDD